MKPVIDETLTIDPAGPPGLAAMARTPCLQPSMTPVRFTPRTLFQIPRSDSSMVWGMTAHWTLLVTVLLGGWLLVAPAVFGSEGTAAANGDRIFGALVITVAMISLAEVTLPLRFLNVAFGGWIVAQPWLLGAPGNQVWSDVLVGLLVIALSFPRGPVRESYGGWNRYLR